MEKILIDKQVVDSTKKPISTLGNQTNNKVGVLGQVTVYTLGWGVGHWEVDRPTKWRD